MAIAADWSPTEDLIGFVEDVVAWTDPIGSTYLDRDQIAMLDAARVEIREVQVPAIRRELEQAGGEQLQAAGFSREQALFKMMMARRAMAATERRAQGRGPQLWRPTREGLESAVGAIKEVLGSISSLSKWIEAVSELVGVVGSGVKSLAVEDGVVRRALRRLRPRTSKRRYVEPAEPASA